MWARSSWRVVSLVQDLSFHQLPVIGTRVGLGLEDPQKISRRVVVPMRIVEVEEQEERPLVHGVQEEERAVGYVLPLPVVGVVEAVEAVVEAVLRGDVQVAGDGVGDEAAVAQEAGQGGDAVVEAVLAVRGAVGRGVHGGHHAEVGGSVHDDTLTASSKTVPSLPRASRRGVVGLG